MTQKVRDIMTKDPVCMTSSTSILDAAKQMSEHNIGDVIIKDGDEISGIVTDRDIVVRAVATQENLVETPIADICSKHLVTVHPDDDVDLAIRRMQENAVRRLPVIEDRQAVGIVSLGDLALVRDRRSALGAISAAPPSH